MTAITDEEREAAAVTLARLVCKGTGRRNYPWLIYKIVEANDSRFPYRVYGRRTKLALSAVFPSQVEAEKYIIWCTK